MYTIKFAVLSLLASYFVTLLVLRFQHLHLQFTADHDLAGAQKIHAVPVPRIGGIAIMAGLLANLLILAWVTNPNLDLYGKIILSSMPAFLGGIVEDFTKRVGVRPRLIAITLSAIFAYSMLGTLLPRLGMPLIDPLLGYTPIALALTVFGIVGVTNSINLIDGLNGLAAAVVISVLVGMAFIAASVGDTLILFTTVSLAGALLGFFPWNFPRGRIFLGDGGAYLAGFVIAILAVMLVQRNVAISPWCPLLLVLHPVFETVFSIYRRMFVRRASPGAPDSFHLHQLVYKRLVRVSSGACSQTAKTTRNSLSSPYLWILNLLAVVPAVLFRSNSVALIFFCAVFMFVYISVYRMIVHFNIPNWMITRAKLNS